VRGLRQKSVFADRRAAGRDLAQALRPLVGDADVLVLGLPRGGVPVAAEVADVLEAELDVFVVRKLGLPRQPELAMGAVASGGVRVLNHDVLVEAAVRADVLDEVTRREVAEVETRERRYRGERPPVPLRGRTVVLVDDGLATGATMRAAVDAARLQQPSRLVVAVPVAPRETVAVLERKGVEVVCLASPDPFLAVGYWYADFAPTTDNEVETLLRADP
jgi:predicted phosphoribosyltransferase